MKPFDLLVDIAHVPLHHSISAEVDGWSAELVRVSPVGGGRHVVTIELCAEHTVLPLDADETMLEAALEELSLPRELAAKAWRVMREAFIADQ
jgi:hypothetical protein